MISTKTKFIMRKIISRDTRVNMSAYISPQTIINIRVLEGQGYYAPLLLSPAEGQGPLCPAGGNWLLALESKSYPYTEIGLDTIKNTEISISGYNKYTDYN